MKAFVDLHNHSCLSPCASLEMSPSRLASIAASRGIDVLALTDHNSALNCPAFAVACGRVGIAPLFGLELNSIEEVHTLCIFATPDEALRFGEELYPSLPDFAWDPAVLGDQVVVDADENVIGFPPRWFGAGLSLGFDELCAMGRGRGALVIPAHVDHQRYSVGSQLGFLPEGPYDAVESLGEPPLALSGGLTALSGSDAHAPEQVGRRPFEAELPPEILAAAVAAVRSFAQEGEGAAFPAAPLRLLLESLRAAFRPGAIRATRPPSRR